MRRVLVTLLVVGCASAPELDDHDAIAALVEEDNARLVAAWEARDATLVFPEGDDSAVAVTPDGRTIGAAELRADLQRRMDMTRSVEEMSVDIASVDVDGDSAVAVSHQRFVRTLVLPDGALRQRISTVTHRQEFLRTDAGWIAAGPVEESDQAARWADEPAPE